MNNILKAILVSGVVIWCVVTSFSARAESLVQVYEQALTSDPQFKKAEADWLTAKQNIALAETGTGAPGTGLYPNIDVSAEGSRSYQDIQSGTLDANGYFDSSNALVSLTQPIFNWATWKSISTARYSVKAATATYLAAAQDLMFRVSQAYFAVLNASDQLRYTLAQKKSVLQELITAQQEFKVGLIAITGVYDAQASYDAAIANEIKDRNNVADQLENLRAITGRSYPSLLGLRDQIPLLIPRPHNIDQWVRTADQQNYLIQSSLYTMLSAREKIKVTEAQRYPTLNLNASYSVVAQGYPPTLAGPNVGLENTTTKTANANLTLNFPIFQGGYVTAATHQDEYRYLSASDQLEFTHREVVKLTRQSYLGVQSGIIQIRADAQTIKSQKNKLEATQAGYSVGTRTMVDVLEAVTSLYQAQQTWAIDRYNYVLSIVTLKQQAGTLSPDDLAEINTWLSQPVSFALLKKPVETSQYATVKLPNPTIDATPPPGGQPTRIFISPQTDTNITVPPIQSMTPPKSKHAQPSSHVDLTQHLSHLPEPDNTFLLPKV